MPLEKKPFEVKKPEKKPLGVTDLTTVHKEIDSLREYIKDLHYDLRRNPNPSSVVARVVMELGKMPKPVKKILKPELIGIITACLEHEKKYSESTYFYTLRDHLEELQKL